MNAAAQPLARSWAVMSIGLALGALAMHFAPREAFDWHRGLAAAEPWRLWTAAFVHLSPWHLQANLLGCGLVAVFGLAARLPPGSTLAWLAAWPLTHAALALQPGLQHYGGLSGLLHAGVAIAALRLACLGSGRTRWIGRAVLGGLAAKLLLERGWVEPMQWVAGWDIPIAGFAHLTGTAAGLVTAGVAIALERRRSPAAQ